MKKDIPQIWPLTHIHWPYISSCRFKMRWLKCKKKKKINTHYNYLLDLYIFVWKDKCIALDQVE